MYDKNSITKEDEDLSMILFKNRNVDNENGYVSFSVFDSMERPMHALTINKDGHLFTTISMHAKGAGSQYNHQYYQTLGPEIVKLVQSHQKHIVIMGGDWNTPPCILEVFCKQIASKLPDHDVKVAFPTYLTHINPESPKNVKDIFYATRYDGFVVIYPKDKKVELRVGGLAEIGISSRKMVESMNFV